ncbi:MAG: sn-glycerol-3-phosphate ABC transporter ATP-binding protein UgpC [Acholeplasmatales bacterium]|nr:sn-glycerol-3-phosphate ABC transporter ATP-binding protein UgpC [Acholeplasmatales bacterium]
MVKIYPYVEKKPRKKLFSRKVVQQTRRGKNLQLTDKGIVAVQNFNLEIKDGEFIVLVGPSGCGKSTTLRMVAGLEEITEGELYIDGKIVNSIEPKDRDIAMVFQNYALYPHMTVYQNMAYSLKIKHVDKEEIDRKVREAAAILNITDYLERKPKNLSGGQRQRVAIGRAIVRNPKVLLMDEPLSNLDAKLRNQMRAEIIKLRQRIDTTFIYVTHDQVEAMTLGDRIVVMKDGFVQQIGTPQDVYDHPRNKFVSGFIGTPRMNYFDASLSINNGDYYVTVDKYRVRLSDDKQERLKKNKVEPQIVTLGVRPDHISVQTGVGVGVVGLVEVSELMGPSVHLHLNVSGNDVIVIVPTLGGVVDYVGKNIKIQFSGELVNLFSKENERNLEYIDEENYHVDESTSLYKSVSKDDEDDLVSPLEAQDTQKPAQDTQEPAQTASVEETKEEKAL